MMLHESIHVTDWFQILFTENRGMAFGMDFISTLGLALFRFIAIGGFIYILIQAIRRKMSIGLVVSLSLIVAGAIGNLIDNCFYGLMFTESPSVALGLFEEPAKVVAFGQGYGEFLTGKVVDMFYFPLFYWPDWMPFVGGDVFFGAIFNIADAAISCGAVALAYFYYVEQKKSAE